jgi:hypothetical protein
MGSGSLVFSASDLQGAMQDFQTEAGKFGNIGSGVPAASGSAFGTLAVCEQLSGLASQLSQACGKQFSAANKFLGATAQALGDARTAYMAAESSNTTAAKNA